MEKTITFLSVLLLANISNAQGPEVTSWLQNTTNTGSYYVSGNSNAIDNGILYNCQQVSYSNDYVYVQTNGIPAYPTGPFQDGNPSQAEAQNAIFRFPRNPQEEMGTKMPTTMGNIGVFINGVALFDNRDGVYWNSVTSSLCGGPGNPPCPGGPTGSTDWARNAVPAEMPGFDCSKGHPAMGNYHHHQNPSAFKLDLSVVSTICNLYDADALYTINMNEHSPLIGFAYDGNPIYGAYAYQNANGSGGIVRMKSSYELGTTPDRTTWPDGTDVDDGPAFDATYFRGYFKEDYMFADHPGQDDYLDEHNGRWCVTPEYPGGTYAYFCTVDANHNSAYPYAVGPTFWGEYDDRLVTSITEAVTVYDASSASLTEEQFDAYNFNVFPNPASDLIAIQSDGLVKEELTIELVETNGRVIAKHAIHAGQTITYFDVSTIYAGTYFVKITSMELTSTHKVVIK
jgi:hypothetical protein